MSTPPATVKNEAASRLLIQWLTGVPRDHDKRLLIDAALAAERRGTVERIRLRVVAIEKRDGDDWAYIAQILDLLDAEAAL